MVKYLLDTNVVMRFCNASDVQYETATNAIAQLLAKEDECFLTPQVLVEFWVVATRPTEVNGLGWTAAQTRATIDQLLTRFPVLEETSQIFPNWLHLVTSGNVIGKRTHDVRLIAIMLAHGVTHLLTFNPGDFAITSEVTVVRPQDLITANEEG